MNLHSSIRGCTSPMWMMWWRQCQMLWRLFLTCPGCGLSTKKARSYVLQDSCFTKAIFPCSINFVSICFFLLLPFTTGALLWFANGGFAISQIKALDKKLVQSSVLYFFWLGQTCQRNEEQHCWARNSWSCSPTRFTNFQCNGLHWRRLLGG